MKKLITLILALALVLSTAAGLADPTQIDGITPREIEIIRLSAEGLKASEIAERTFLSVHTVNTHRQHIYAKMNVKNVADMLRKAGELGIL